MYAADPDYGARMVDSSEALEVLRETADAVRTALDGLSDWGPSGERAGQYRSDLVADAAATGVLLSAGLAVVSEESGRSGAADAELVAVLDPLDGSTNASRGLPWFATSICLVDDKGPFVALVVNQATGTRYEATRGGGATRDGRPVSPSPQASLGGAILGLAGYPPHYLGWRQFRALGAAALDLCAVADGTLDGYADCSRVGHGVWDYLAALLVCREAGAVVSDATGEELVILDHEARRAPLAGCRAEVHDALLSAWREAFADGRGRPQPAGGRLR